VSLDLLPPDLVPFHRLDAPAIGLIALIYALTATIRGAFGFGAVAPAIVFSSFITDPHHAVLLALATGAWSQAQVVPFGLRHGDWQVAKPLFIAGFAAVAAGVFVFKRLEPGWLTVCLGVVMLAIVAMDRYRVLERLAARIDIRNTATALGLSTASGLMAGIAGGGGMYLYSVYIKFACPSPTLMRGTSILVGSIFLYWRFLVAIAMGLVSLRLIAESLLLVPPSLLGAWLGIRFFHRADARRFYGAFQAVLLTGAVVLLWKGIGRVL
ncbi:MAG TPA: TSUP family transporter, partial [Alphaproteobacteria bacterium]|jgi:uncharacterized membrane protein YfcA